LILAVGKKEVEERSVALRCLGSENERQIPMTLAEAVTQPSAEATPPDLARR
jgi:threonyl-tRNA synthetase